MAERQLERQAEVLQEVLQAEVRVHGDSAGAP